MQLIENIVLAFHSLAANKMRSLLTMLGIIIGISAVITITTIGNSIQSTLTSTFSSFDIMNYFSLYVMERPYVEQADSLVMVVDEDVEDYVLTDEDLISRDMLERLTDTYPGHFTIDISESFGESSVLTENGDTVHMHTTGIISSIPGNDFLYGRCISLEDNKQLRRTIVVSDIFVKQYFGENINAMGKIIPLTLSNGNTYDFAIVGVYEYSQSLYGAFSPGQDDMDKVTPVQVPLDTIYSLLGTDKNQVYYYVNLKWNTDYDPAVLKDELRTFFDEAYQNNQYWGVVIENNEESFGMVNTVINVITIAISVIAAISLIVGGVGVMNIMLVSITERTKEIGIRKALGAQNSAIRMQFVIEAILICLIGGLIGIMLGIFNGMAVGQIAKNLVTVMAPEYAKFIVISVEPSVPAILISVLFSMLTGVFFGYYPANKAAKMNPIDALRYD